MVCLIPTGKTHGIHNKMSRKISEGRKATFYIGTGLMVLGGLSFLSVFVTAIGNFGDFSNFEENARSEMARGFGGMILLIVGIVIRTVGARGLAGSGVVLDPEKAREELEPYSRMAGGMVKDVLDEADVKLGGGGSGPEEVIMIRCTKCGTLNEDGSKFCQECGEKL